MMTKFVLYDGLKLTKSQSRIILNIFFIRFSVMTVCLYYGSKSGWYLGRSLKQKNNNSVCYKTDIIIVLYYEINFCFLFIV